MADEPTAADLGYMRLALELAAEAGERGDVPVGAVVVRDGRILGVGFNNREQDHDPTGHAEVVAMREACRQAQRWRLDGASLYVTLEPCPMCAGTVVNTRITRLVYGAHDPKAGAVRSLYQLCEDPRLNHRVQVIGGVLGDECAALLKGFFRAARARARRQRAAGNAEPRWHRGDET
ncbi:tRNA-specific adenosine-34 deaminase [Enhygromyxa salina]|uniref:tRNA-specific adenosine deaminase n=2 Tax=Enhygromyxa salina TaxID=215803 RepID=A0A0C2D0F2_9BACT|nr:tRNA-specific adenosine-34 deaminase [Enhygromyxa salina]